MILTLVIETAVIVTVVIVTIVTVIVGPVTVVILILVTNAMFSRQPFAISRCFVFYLNLQGPIRCLVMCTHILTQLEA